MKYLIGLAILLLLGGAVFFLSTEIEQSGPGISPERQLAESIVHSLKFGGTVPNDCPEPEDISIPRTLVVDEAGIRRTDEEIDTVIGHVICLSDLLYERGQVPDDFMESWMLVFSGQDVEFPTGIVFPGSKPSVRGSLLHMTMVGILFSDPLVFGDDQCGKLKEWSLSGETLELKFLAFGSYIASARDCVTTTPAWDLDVLLALTKANDVDAALTLVRYWGSESLTAIPENPEDRTDASIEAEISKYEEIIEQNRQRYPLLSLVATVEIANILSLEVSPYMIYR